MSTKIWIRKSTQALLLGVVCAGFTGKAMAASEEEARREFAKEYGSQFPDDRKKAVEKLSGAKEAITAKAMYSVGIGDGDENVRAAAVAFLFAIPDNDSSISSYAAQIFLNEKTKEAKQAFAKSMSTLEFKYEPLRVMIDWLMKCRYPAMPDDNDNNNNNNNNQPLGSKSSTGGSGGGGGSVAGGMGAPSKELVQKSRDYYVSILNSINALSGEHFTPGQRSTEQIKKWWDVMSPKIFKTDADLRLAKKAAMEPAKKDVAAKDTKAPEANAKPDPKRNPLKDVLDKNE